MDVIYTNLNTMEEYDIDEEFDIDVLAAVSFDSEDQHFYILSNKHKNLLGFFLLCIDKDTPLEGCRWLMKIQNNLDTGDAKVHIVRDGNQAIKELIVSYKLIYMNTYNVIVMEVDGTPLFKHESFQLWEHRVRGILIQNSKDFVTFSKQGL